VAPRERNWCPPSPRKLTYTLQVPTKPPFRKKDSEKKG
jgi:hypothetical protein